MFIIDCIFVKLTENQDRHKISNEFEFWPVICPWLLEKAIVVVVQGIVLSFCIGSQWNLQINWASIKFHKCSKFGQSGLFTSKLPALIAEKTIFDLLGMLDSGELSLPFGRLVVVTYVS